MKYEGTIFGFNYEIEKETDEEFMDWLIGKLKKQNPLLAKTLDRLLEESPSFVEVKDRVKP